MKKQTIIAIVIAVIVVLAITIGVVVEQLITSVIISDGIVVIIGRVSTIRERNKLDIVPCKYKVPFL